MPKEKNLLDLPHTEHGNHLDLKLPCYNCSLSPNELAWANVKRFIRSNNADVEFSLNTLGTFN